MDVCLIKKINENGLLYFTAIRFLLPMLANREQPFDCKEQF